VQVHITLSYITELDVEDGKLRLTLPTAIGARAGEASGGASSKVASTATHVSGAPLVVQVLVQAHSAITGVECPSHQVTTQLGIDGSSRRAKVTLTHGSLSLGADFRLLIAQLKPHTACVWVETPPQGSAHEAVEAGTATGATAASAAGGSGKVAGANDVSKAPASIVACMFPDMQAMDLDNDAAGEYIFVVDRSGSMSGSRMRHAQDALQMCLRAIPAGSNFNIVGFGTRVEHLFAAPQPYNDATLAQAAEHVQDMKANLGGTNLMQPLQSVFGQAPNPALPRQVLLLTDGEVRDTRAVIALVRKSCAPSGTRMFTFGIGREVSHALVLGCATAGGGAAEFISPDERMESKVMRQMNKAVQPVMTNVTVHWGELADFTTHAGTPSVPLPLFQGNRTMRYTSLQLTAGTEGALKALPATATVKLTASTPDGPMEWPMLVRLPAELVAASAAAAGVDAPAPAAPDSDDEDEGDAPEVQCSLTVGRMVATAAARSRIRDLEALDTPKAKAEGVQLACAYDVACKWASFVAVDMNSSVATLDEDEDDSLELMQGTRAGYLVSRPSGSSRRESKKSKSRNKGLQVSGAAPSRSRAQATAMAPVERSMQREEKLDSLSFMSDSLSASSSSFASGSRSKGGGGGFMASIGQALGFGGSNAQGAVQAQAEVESSDDDDADLEGALGMSAPMGDAPMQPKMPSASMPAPAMARAAAAAPPPGGPSRPAAAPAAASSAPLGIDAGSATPEQLLKAIVGLQRSDGSFPMCRAVQELTLKIDAEVQAAAPGVGGAGDAAVAMCVWATALVLAVLHSRVGAFHEEWQAMASKAGKWLRRSVKHVNVEGGDAKEQVAALQSAAVAFLG